VVSGHDELRTGGGPPDDAPLVRYQRRGKVAVLTIDRPERHNAWTFEVEKELFDLADRADSDDRVGAVVLTGAGTSFCPGMDMKVLADLGAGPGVAARPRRIAHEPSRRPDVAEGARAFLEKRPPAFAPLPGRVGPGDDGRPRTKG
jgi:enoyl-CoA hydratase/carnithine racemase